MAIKLVVIFITLTNGMFFVNGEIKGTLKEELPPDTPILDLREILNVPLEEFPSFKFQIMEQYITVKRSTVKTIPAPTSPSAVWIKVDEQSGILKQHGRVDRESLCGDDECNIIIKWIMLPQETFRFETVNLKIVDTNDIPPTFSHSSIDIDVPETLEVGQEVSLDSFQATDTDTGNNSVITYTLRPVNYFNVKQSMDENGSHHLSLILTQPLDYEGDKVHRMTLDAQDDGLPSLRSSIEVRINVIDENDNAPVFEKQLYEATVAESIPSGQNIGFVRATDGDAGLNGNIRYFIRKNRVFSQLGKLSSKCPISVNEVTGAVKVIEKLDHKVHDGMKIVIGAKDGNEAKPKKGRTVFLLHVTDVNDHDPVIDINYIVLHRGNTAYISESNSKRIFLAYVTATDADKGNNSEVTLKVETFVPGINPELGVTELGDFVIENDLLTTTKTMDREVRDRYDIIITASDKGSPVRTSKLHVSVIVLDENEHSPVFLHSPIRLAVPENETVGTVLTVVTASDQDSEKQPAWRKTENNEIEPSKNGEIVYELTPAKVGDGVANNDIPVMIDPTSGEVTLIRALDYETQKLWQFIVTARDGGRPVALQTSCNLIIEVVNINDNRPIFINPDRDNTTVYASTIASSDVFTRIHAVDFDDNISSNIRYTFNVVEKDDVEVVGNMYNKLFKLNKGTGEFHLKENSFLIDEIQGNYKVMITAKDYHPPYLESHLTIYINVVDIIPTTSLQINPITEASIEDSYSPLIVFIGAGVGGVVLLMLLFIVIILSKKKRTTEKKSTDKEFDEASQSLSASSPPDGEEVLSIRPRGGSSVSSLDRKKVNCAHMYNTTSTQKSSLSTVTREPCQICDAPNTTKEMLKYLGKHQDEKSARRGYASWAPNPMWKLDLSPVGSEETLSRNCSATWRQDEINSTGGQCTELCKLYGHSDACWMPITDRTAMLQPTSPVDVILPWQQRLDSNRKDSGCSIDTTSSELPYYKLSKSDQKRHNDVFLANDEQLPDVIGKCRTVVNSDASSLMSLATSSGASSSRLINNRRMPSTSKSPGYRVLKKSNSDVTGALIKTSTRTPVNGSMSTQC